MNKKKSQFYIEFIYFLNEIVTTTAITTATATTTKVLSSIDEHFISPYFG